MADSRLTTTTKSNKRSFEDHMENFTKYGFTLVSLVLGYDLGLFDILRNATTPLTSIEIAERAGLKERYVREWLGALTAAQVIEVEDKDGVCRYSLSNDDYVAIIPSVTLGRGICDFVDRLDTIKNCFKEQGPSGDPDAFDGNFWSFFGRVREEESITILQDRVFPYLESVDDIHRKLDKGCSVLDIGCGNGQILMKYAERYPNSYFTGFDVSEDVLEEARATSAGFHNIKYKHGNSDDMCMDFKETFDIIFLFQVLHNLPDPLKMIENVRKLLKTSGHLVLWELKHHSNHAENVGNMSAAAAYTFSQFYCLPYSMSNRPHIGYGVGWGKENMLEAICKHFTLISNFTVSSYENIYCLTKHSR